MTSRWKILSTPPMSGPDNMAYDLSTLLSVQDPDHPPVLRFFRFNQPTVSYGKHQSLEKIRLVIPPGWECVQRPTGGGVVFHERDLCLSLCWRAGEPPLPLHLKDHYSWIHKVILEALPPFDARLADCRDCSSPPAPFETRACFTQPVAFDVLAQGQKIVGGALCRRREGILYQGSIQLPTSHDVESRLGSGLRHALAPS